MFVYVELIHTYLNFFSFSLLRPAKTKFMVAKLCAVLVCKESDFKQSLTPCSVSHFWNFEKFNLLTPHSVSQRRVRLRGTWSILYFLKGSGTCLIIG